MTLDLEKKENLPDDKGLVKVLKKSVKACLERHRKAPRLKQFKFQVGYMDDAGDCYFIEMKVSKTPKVPSELKINKI